MYALRHETKEKCSDNGGVQIIELWIVEVAL